MGIIQKFFQSKKIVENFIKVNGMEEAVKKYGINKLVMYKILVPYEDTNFYCDYNFSAKARLFDANGKVVCDIYRKVKKDDFNYCIKEKGID